MAIIDNEILKGCRGTLDGFVIYSCRGKTCLRTKAEKVNITFPPEMVRQKERIAGVAALYQAVKAAGIYPVWQKAADGSGLTGYNLFVRWNNPAFTGEGEVGDFAKVHLTMGKLQLPDRMDVARSGAGEWVLTWDNVISYPGTAEDDRLVVALAGQAKGFAVKVPEIGDYRRKHCRAVIRLPTQLRDYTHLFCYFRSAAGEGYSVSRYFLLMP